MRKIKTQRWMSKDEKEKKKKELDEKKQKEMKEKEKEQNDSLKKSTVENQKTDEKNLKFSVSGSDALGENKYDEKEFIVTEEFERPYDVVIIDEVDNMLIDQQSSPSILSRDFPIEYSTDILQIVYLLQREEIEDIKKVLNYYFSGKSSFDYNTIKKIETCSTSSFIIGKRC